MVLTVEVFPNCGNKFNVMVPEPVPEKCTPVGFNVELNP